MKDVSFNLIDEGWIPCLMVDSEYAQTRLLSLQQVLTNAHNIKAIADDSPPVTVSLHRLLLAVLHRVFGPDSVSTWNQLWKKGCFDKEPLLAYLEKQKDRFDLLDRDFPFYQTAEIPFEECTTSIAKLAVERAAGNAATLFDHSTDRKPMAISLAQAARYVVATQAFAIGGLVSFRDGESKKTYRSAKAAPLVKGAVCYVQGENLFQTLMLSLHRYDGSSGEPFDFDPDKDVPAWEGDGTIRPKDRVPLGYIDLLTWQSRRLRLKPEKEENGRIVIRHVALMKGNQFPDNYHRRDRETMLAFRRNERASGKQDPWPALSFNENRALWRDSLTLFQSLRENRSRPKILDWLSELVEQDVIEPRRVLPLAIAGLSTNRAKVLFWRQEILPLHLAYLHDDELIASLDLCLSSAEKGSRALYNSVRRLAVLISETQQEGGSSADPDRVSQIIEDANPDRRYWPQLEPPFRQLLLKLPEASDKLDVCEEWVDHITNIVHKVFNQVVDGFESSPRVMRAVYSRNGAQHRLNASLIELREGGEEEENATAS